VTAPVQSTPRAVGLLGGRDTGSGIAESDATVVATPTLRALARRSSFWIIAAIGIVIVAIVAVLVSGGTNVGGRALAGNNAGPAGSMAVVQVLRQQGVTVTLVDSLARAHEAAGVNSTVLLYDEGGYLDSEQVAEVAGLTANTVVVAPDFLALQALAPTIGFGGVSNAPALIAGCAVPAAKAAEELLPAGDTLSIPDGQRNSRTTGCFASDANTFSLVQVQGDTGNTVSLVPDARLFNNENISGYGNAALVLGLLGTSDSLVWYLPTVADVPRTGPASLAEVTPGWVTPVLILSALVAALAAVWRGRRFGALVTENLPVTVKASETMEGRARLYARTNARLRALDALRVGALQRLAQSAGIGRLAPLEEVIGAVAEVTGRTPHDVRQVLVGAIPRNDAELKALADALHGLEQATSQAVQAPAAPAADPWASAPVSFTTPPDERMDL